MNAYAKGKSEAGVKYVKRNCLAGQRPPTLDLAQGRWTTAPEARNLIVTTAQLGQSLLPCPLQRACDQSVLGLDAFELALGALSPEASPFNQKFTLCELGLPGLLGLGQCGEGRCQAGGRERLQEGLDDSLLEPDSTQALAGLLRGV